MKLSVAMATYNGERFLREQLDSIASQSRLPDELVVTDDSSISDTSELLENFAANANFPVRIFRNQARLGYRANFFKALSLCEGDIIALCDQDDVWKVDKLSRLLPPFEDPKLLLATHDIVLVDEHLKPLEKADARNLPYRGVQEPLTAYPWSLALGMSIAFRRDLLSWVDPAGAACLTEKELGHDVWLWFVASSMGKVAVIKEPLALYRQHAKNVFGAIDPRTSREKLAMARRAGASVYLKRAKDIGLLRGNLKTSATAPEWLTANAEKARMHHEKFERWYLDRASLYQQSQRWHRLRTIVHLLRSGAYSEELGWRALMKDSFMSFVKQSAIG